MENEAWRTKLSENLTELRKKNKMTQSELGEKLNYTDKSVSKWERGEGVPDVSVLVKLSDMYGVSVDELLGRKAEEAAEVPAKKQVRHPILHKTAILLIMGCGIVMLACGIYALLSLIVPSLEMSWLAFVIALPCVFAAGGVWFTVWKNWPWAVSCYSAAMWTLCVTLNLAIPAIPANMLYAVGGVLQLGAIIAYAFHVLKKAK